MDFSLVLNAGGETRTLTDCSTCSKASVYTNFTARKLTAMVKCILLGGSFVNSVI